MEVLAPALRRIFGPGEHQLQGGRRGEEVKGARYYPTPGIFQAVVHELQAQSRWSIRLGLVCSIVFGAFLCDRARQITVHQLVEVHVRATTVDQSLQRGQILVETTEDELSHGALFLIIAGEIGRTLEGIDQHRFRLDIIFEVAAGGDMLTN